MLDFLVMQYNAAIRHVSIIPSLYTEQWRSVHIFKYSRRTRLPDAYSCSLATRVSLRFAGDGAATSFLQTLPL